MNKIRINKKNEFNEILENSNKVNSSLKNSNEIEAFYISHENLKGNIKRIFFDNFSPLPIKFNFSIGNWFRLYQTNEDSNEDVIGRIINKSNYDNFWTIENVSQFTGGSLTIPENLSNVNLKFNGFLSLPSNIDIILKINGITVFNYNTTSGSITSATLANMIKTELESLGYTVDYATPLIPNSDINMTIFAPIGTGSSFNGTSFNFTAYLPSTTTPAFIYKFTNPFSNGTDKVEGEKTIASFTLENFNPNSTLSIYFSKIGEYEEFICSTIFINNLNDTIDNLINELNAYSSSPDFVKINSYRIGNKIYIELDYDNTIPTDELKIRFSTLDESFFGTSHFIDVLIKSGDIEKTFYQDKIVWHLAKDNGNKLEDLKIQNLRIFKKLKNSVLIKWNEPKTNSKIKSYSLRYRKVKESSNTNWIEIENILENQFLLNSLENLIFYEAKVMVNYGENSFSKYSEIVKFRTK